MKTEIIEETSGDATEVAELKKQLAAAEDKMLWAGLPSSPEFDALVAVKMRAGLSREQAIECSRRQVLSSEVTKDRDAAVAKAISEVDKEWQGKDKRLPDYREQRAAAISKALVDGN